MTEVAIKLKILPESLETDLEPIKKQGKEKIEAQGGKINNYEEQPIAFGLKALVATISLDENKGTDLVEEIFLKIPGVSSVEVIDYRRTIG